MVPLLPPPANIISGAGAFYNHVHSNTNPVPSSSYTMLHRAGGQYFANNQPGNNQLPMAAPTNPTGGSIINSLPAPNNLAKRPGE